MVVPAAQHGRAAVFEEVDEALVRVLRGGRIHDERADVLQGDLGEDLPALPPDEQLLVFHAKREIPRPRFRRFA